MTQRTIPCEEFTALLERGHGGLSDYARSHLPRFYRIANELLTSPIPLCGPCLDVGSVSAELYPFIKTHLSHTLPYEMTALGDGAVVCCGDAIPIKGYNCERDRLDYPDRSVGLMLFFDVLEHLLVDPMAALLEFNRVVKTGGCLAINTPNANSIDRVLRLLRGQQVATESFYKPTGLYDRHNREWNIAEVLQFLELGGFAPRHLTTHGEQISDADRRVLEWAQREQLTDGDISIFGPEIFCIAEKVRDVSETTMSRDQRWPAWLYSGFDAYRRRPDVFPLI